jgi:ArsR family transcriptional regulator
MNGKDAVAALSALAHDSRLQVFRVLVQQGPEGMPVGDINKRVHIPATTLSFHLAQLSHAGLVTSRRNGRSISYAANYKSMQGLMDFLMENCCKGDSRGCAPVKGSRNAQDRDEGELLRPDMLRRGGSPSR